MTDKDVLNAARRITTGVDVPEDEEEEFDPYDPVNMSFIEIGENASDPEWMASYGHLVPDETWQKIEKMIKEGVNAGTD